MRLRTEPGDPRRAVSGAAVVITALSIGLTGASLDPGAVRPDALLLPLDYASSVGPDLAAGAVLAADDVTAFEAVRGQGRLGDYPSPQEWSGALLARPRPDGRVVCQNLGNGLGDLVIADAVWRAALESGVGQVVDGSGT